MSSKSYLGFRDHTCLHLLEVFIKQARPTNTLMGWGRIHNKYLYNVGN